jgi:hypothetical protein
MLVRTGRSEDRGLTVLKAVGQHDLPKDQTLHFRARIRAVALGPGQIRLRARAKAPYGIDAGAADIFLTVGRTPAESKFGIDVTRPGATTRAP